MFSRAKTRIWGAALAVLIEYLLECLAKVTGVVLVAQSHDLFDFLRISDFCNGVNLVAID